MTTGWSKEEVDPSRPVQSNGSASTIAIWEEKLDMLIPEIDLDGNIKNIKKLDFDKLPGQR
jgi:hypothetical protein